jgi:UDP-N-acetylmuramoyl-L-alanyl-D-glutamate--2,6-diaminopimelate ligase
MEKYFEAKKIFFDMLKPEACAVFNVDDPYGVRIASSTAARKISYGIDHESDVRAERVSLSMNGTSLDILYQGERFTITTPLIGRFNAYNVLSAVAAALGMGISREKIQEGISRIANVRGRFERIASPKGWTAIVDYAHTPDALENCLRTIHDILPKEDRGTIITVFGAGGDRDKTKRPLMGEIAGRMSDLVIVTSDNPRTEDPEAIIDEVLRGIVQHASVLRESDRACAIERALCAAKKGDVVLVAGKGHEDYQIIGKEKRHFSDREVIERLL